MHCVQRAPKLATPCHKKGRPFVYLQDAQKCISFPVHCASVQGICMRLSVCAYVCVSPAHPFDCLHFDKQSHFNFRIYFWVWISQLSSAFNARACNAFLLCSCACVCVCACVVCLLHFSLCKKLHTIFCCCVSFRVLFFRNAFNKIARFTSCIFCAHCRHKKQEKTNEKMHSQLGWILWAFLYAHTHTYIARCRHRFFRQLSTVFAYVVLILIASHRICMLYTFLIPFPTLSRCRRFYLL